VHICISVSSSHSFAFSSFSFAAPPQLPFNTRPSPVPEHPSGSILPPTRYQASGLPHLGHRSFPNSPTAASSFGSVRPPTCRHASGLPHLGRSSTVSSRAAGPSQSSIQTARVAQRQSADRMNTRTSAPRSGRRHPRPYPGFTQTETTVDLSFSTGNSMDPKHDDRTCCVMIIPHQVRRLQAPFHNVSVRSGLMCPSGSVPHRPQSSKWLYIQAQGLEHFCGTARQASSYHQLYLWV
jgi:hypothetical protein